MLVNDIKNEIEKWNLHKMLVNDVKNAIKCWEIWDLSTINWQANEGNVWKKLQAQLKNEKNSHG